MTDRLAELGALQYAVENLSTAGTNPNRLGLAGYIHAAYTDYQTWAAANPGVNPNRLSARGRIYGYFYDNASWSPTSLFANSEVGAWYDPSDLTTMFQDSAGTTPVTADGQPVGKILDKSGRGNHASQATAASRPLYKTDGTYHWLQFDGVDDWLITAAIDFTATDKLSVFNSGSSSSSGMVVEFGNDSAGGFYMFSNSATAFASEVGLKQTTTNLGYTPTPVTGKVVATALFDFAGVLTTDQKKLRVNAIAQNLSSGSNLVAEHLHFGNLPLYIVSRGGSSLFKNSNIYSMIVLGRLATTQEITDTETWVNSKCGAF